MRTFIVVIISLLVALTGCDMAGMVGLATKAPNVESVVIQYDGSTVYTSSIDLDVLVTWSDGVEETEVITVNAPADGAGVVTASHEVEGVSDSEDVVFDDIFLGHWTNDNDTKTFTIYGDGTYDAWTVAWGFNPEVTITNQKWYIELDKIYFIGHQPDSEYGYMIENFLNTFSKVE